MYFPFELEILKAVQSVAGPVPDAIFLVLSYLGNEMFVVAVLAFFYWCVNKEVGRFLGFAGLFSMSVNGVIKDALRFTRPIGLEGINSRGYEGLAVINSPTGYEYSYSFPSGHSQFSATLGAGVADRYRRRWLTALAVIVPVLVAASRLYDGVHFPKDVAAGLILGWGIALLCSLFWKKVKNRTMLYVGALLALLILCAVFGGTDDTVKTVGSYVGFVAGILFDDRFVRFSVEGSYPRRAARLVLGLALTLAAYFGLKTVMPDSLVFGFLRYALLIFFTVGIYPLIAKKLRL